jgi:hypothetical protein
MKTPRLLLLICVVNLGGLGRACAEIQFFAMNTKPLAARAAGGDGIKAPPREVLAQTMAAWKRMQVEAR